MHHKFLVLKKNITDKPLVMTGSFNFTGNAHQSWENIVILDDTEAITKFEEEFNTVLHYSSDPLTEKECISLKDTAQTNQGQYSRKINAFPKELIESSQPNTDIPEKCLIVDSPPSSPPKEKKKGKRKPSSKQSSSGTGRKSFP